jgi:hypothetical protein
MTSAKKLKLSLTFMSAIEPSSSLAGDTKSDRVFKPPKLLHDRF